MESTVLGNRYELMEKIGDGGMAYVYKARCRTLDRIVAVKILKEEFLGDHIFVEKFNTEALAAAQLSHPNIVNVYDVGHQDNSYYIVMEYVEGKTLKELISEEAPLSVEKAVDIAIMICDGIQHAHIKGLIHRDIKPHNILITSGGMVKVADFGIAQAISKKTITFGGNIVGSVHYISPEQAKGEPVNPTTDIYSLGCVLYEMLTAKVPFDAESPITVALKHIHDQPLPPRSINNAIPESLEAIILRAMDKLPFNRFASAEKMRNALIGIDNAPFTGYSRQHMNGKTRLMAPLTDEENDNPGKKKKIRTSFIAGVIIAVLGLLGGFLSVMSDNIFPAEVVVPEILGMEIKEADAELKKVGLTMNVIAHEFNDEFDVDKIIYQDPAQNQKVKEGREIKVKLSKGSELQKVPNVVGLKLSDAQIELKNKNLTTGLIEKKYDDKYPEDAVISQSPVAESKVEKGSKIDLMVSKGKTPERASMPNLLGLSLKDATKKLQDNNLLLGEIKRKDSSEYYTDQVMAQDIEAGVLVDEQTSVGITLSKGPGPTAQVKDIEFQLPAEQDYYKVVIILKDSKGERQVYEELHRGGEPVYAAISYYGSGEIQVKLNGKAYKTIKL